MSKIAVWMIAVVLVVIAVLVALRYRDNALTYQKQRDDARQTVATLHQQAQAAAALDAEHTRKLADALSDNDRLRSAGRVYVKARCPAVPGTATTGSVGASTAVELTGESRRLVFDTRGGIIADREKIDYLQEYISTQCLRSK